MKRKVTILVICSVFAILAALVIQQSTEAQFPGGPGGMPGGMNIKSIVMGSLQTSWAGLSFELDLDDDRLAKARKIYQEEWDELSKLAKEVEEAGGGMGSIQALRDETTKLDAKRNEKLKDILSEEEMAKLEKWEKENTRQMGGRQRGSRGNRR